MNIFINYLIEANLSLIFCLLIYWGLLGRENQFAFKRIYLLTALLFSLAFPLLHFTNGFSKILIPSMDQVVPTSWLPPVFINGGEAIGTESKPAMGIWNIIEIGYLAIGFCLLALFVVRVFNILQLILGSEKYKWQNCLVAESREEKPTFSFFNFIFIGRSHLLSKSEKEEILLHEAVHVRHKHSIDIAFIHLVGIVCWFNPIIKIYKKELVQLHEFEADSKSVESKDIDQYCGLLAKVALRKINYPLVNHFNQSLTLKRITMMKTMKQKIQLWKMATLLVASALLFFVISCNDQISHDLKEITKNSSTSLVLPSEIKSQLQELQQKNPAKEYTVIEMNEEGRKTLEKLKFQNAESTGMFSAMHVIHTDIHSEGEGRSYVILEKNSTTDLIANTTAVNEVFTIVEESAAPKDGIEEFYKFVAQNMKYPQSARTAKTEGKLFVEFVVNTNGSLSDFKIVKGLSSDCEQEAIRILTLSPPWNPGKQRGQAVKQRMVMPFIFSLQSESKAPITTSEMKSVDETMEVDFTKSRVNGKTIIKGIVSNKSDGSPISGVNVVLKNSTNGTVTSSDGAFDFESPTAGGSLLFSFIGFKMHEIKF